MKRFRIQRRRTTTTTTTTRHEIVTVIGATGHQGSGVVAALLRHPDPQKTPHRHHTPDTTEYAVRAVTSNPSGSKAQSLLSAHPSAASSQRLILVQANLADVESLKEAIRGSYGVFFAGPLMPGEGAKAEKSEEARWGRVVVDAVKVSFPNVLLLSVVFVVARRSDSSRAKRRRGKTDSNTLSFFLSTWSHGETRSETNQKTPRPAESNTLSTRP